MSTVACLHSANRSTGCDDQLNQPINEGTDHALNGLMLLKERPNITGNMFKRVLFRMLRFMNSLQCGDWNQDCISHNRCWLACPGSVRLTLALYTTPSPATTPKIKRQKRALDYEFQ